MSLKFFTRFFLMSLLALLSLPGVSLAHPPAQEPVFEVVFNNSAILSQKATLNASYFARSGTLNGLIVDSGSLRLAPGAGSGTFTSNPVRSPLGVTTDLVPAWRAELPEGSSFELEVRFSSNGSNWDNWRKVPALSNLENAGGFISSNTDEEAGVMVWIGSKKPVYLQIRFTLSAGNSAQLPALYSLSLIFSDASRGPTDAAIAAQFPFRSAAGVCPAPKPAIVSRVQWGNPEGQSSPRWTPQQTELTHLIIAHTATPNNLSWYGVNDWAAVVRAIWNYHANTLGWGDIGYNYLVDPNGVIYEGRAGSQEGKYDITGAHDGKNANSMGLAFIGCYGNCQSIGLPNANPPQTMMNKGVELMAWKLGEKGIDAHAYNSYHGLRLPVIAGARDVYSTYSPGEILYTNWLPWLRDAVATRTDCPDSGNTCQISDIVFDKGEYTVNDPINMTVYLKDPAGSPLGGASVSAQTSLLSAAFNAAFNFDDHTGEYTASYFDTGTPGLYAFTVTAVHPDFGTCTRIEKVEVKNSSTQPTPTPNFTPTPSPTPLPTPSGASVTMSSMPLNLFQCGITGKKTDLNANNVGNLRAFSFKLRFNPNIVQVVDANSNQSGVQVTLGKDFADRGAFVAVNKVDNALGLIELAATLMGGNSLDGSIVLAGINWSPRQAGSSNLTFDEISLINADGTAIDAFVQNGRIEVNAGCGNQAELSGQVQLQGRSNYSGVNVSNGQTQTQTGTDGLFTISGSAPLSVTHPGYLSAQSSPQGSAAGLQASSLGSITLLAGDVTGDDAIDILDLAYIANRYQSNDSLADLNADGLVNVIDLALTAANFQQQGPLTNWQ